MQIFDIDTMYNICITKYKNATLLIAAHQFLLINDMFHFRS